MKLKSYKHIIILFLICVISIFSFPSVYAQPGTIDPTYGENGIFIGRNYGNCYGAIIQQDGKLIMVGEGEGEGFWGFSIVRLTIDGQPDESFGTDGRVVTDFRFEIQGPFDAALQSDGKIIIAGVNYEDEISTNNFVIARYFSDGKLDSSFGENGKVVTNFTGKDYGYSVLIQVDGKIVVSGSNNSEALIARYNIDGSLDESFGMLGKVVTKIYNFPIMNSMAIQADGKILLAGTVSQNQKGSVAVCRYMPDGKPDDSFGTNGVLISDWVQGYGEICNAIKIQDDGKLVLAGVVVTNGAEEEIQALVRYNNDGSFDESFGEDGRALKKIENSFLRPLDIKIDINGNILTAGIYYDYDFKSFYLTRYLSNGQKDVSFGEDGFVSSDIGGGDWAWSLNLQQDGKIILAGQSVSSVPIAESNFAAIRYNGGEGSLPITYKNFTATQKNGFIQLNWQTANEINNGYFTVERSITGSAFIEIARVKSNGSGNTAASYIYADKLAQDGNNYYRLKQVDKDGKSSYSKTISISFVKNGNIKIQPNPVKDKLIVSGLAAGENNTLMITDIEGAILKKINTATSQQEINVQQLLPGSYILSVKNNKGNFVAKFLKH